MWTLWGLTRDEHVPRFLSNLGWSLAASKHLFWWSQQESNTAHLSVRHGWNWSTCSKVIWSKRRKGLIGRRSLISWFLDFFVKPFLLQKQIYLGLQKFFFFSSVVVLLGRKHKTILENKAFSKFSALLPGLDEEGEEIPHGEDSEP